MQGATLCILVAICTIAGSFAASIGDNVEPFETAPLCPACVFAKCERNMTETGWNLPYPHDCTKFCKCSWSGALENPCPVDTLFNSDKGLCDWPQNATCSNSDPYPGC